jgi:hypothetical protein
LREERAKAGERVIDGVGVEERVVRLEDEDESEPLLGSFEEVEGPDARRIRAGIVWRIEDIFSSRWSSVDLGAGGFGSVALGGGVVPLAEGGFVGLVVGRGIEGAVGEPAARRADNGEVRLAGESSLETRLLDRQGRGGEAGYSVSFRFVSIVRIGFLGEGACLKFDSVTPGVGRLGPLDGGIGNWSSSLCSGSLGGGIGIRDGDSGCWRPAKEEKLPLLRIWTLRTSLGVKCSIDATEARFSSDAARSPSDRPDSVISSELSEDSDTRLGALLYWETGRAISGLCTADVGLTVRWLVFRDGVTGLEGSICRFREGDSTTTGLAVPNISAVAASLISGVERSEK